MYSKSTLRQVDGAWFVEYEATEYSRPVLVRHLWAVGRWNHGPYACGAPLPVDGMELTGGRDGIYQHGGSYDRIEIYLADGGRTQPTRTERFELLAPKARGKAVEWRDGEWVRELARGWVPAGIGAPGARLS